MDCFGNIYQTSACQENEQQAYCLTFFLLFRKYLVVASSSDSTVTFKLVHV